jgi:photosystem II stability/assembly factor-like uncharacterized protein
VQSLAFDGTNLLAGLLYSGIWRSSDGGKSWQPTEKILPEPSAVITLALSATRLFAGTTNGIFRSDDQGQSWSPAGPGAHYIRSILSDDADIFAVTDKGFHRSSDGGQNWQQVSGASDVRVIALTRGRLLAGTGRGFLLSDDKGRNWLPVKTGSRRDPFLASLAVIGNEVLAGASDGEILRSTDRGQSWATLNTGLPDHEWLTFVASGADLFTISGQELLVSTNNGQSWRPVGLREQAYSLAVVGDKLLASTRRGVMTSTDRGATWILAGETNLAAGAFAVSGGKIFAASNGVYLSTDDGGSWTDLSAGLNDRDVRMLAATRGNLYARTHHGKLYRRPIS